MMKTMFSIRRRSKKVCLSINTTVALTLQAQWRIEGELRCVNISVASRSEGGDPAGMEVNTRHDMQPESSMPRHGPAQIDVK